MLFYTTCFCGIAYGDVYELFKQIKYDMMVEKYSKEDMIMVANLPISTEVDQISLNPIFEILGIKTDCCKMKLLGAAEFEQLLK